MNSRARLSGRQCSRLGAFACAASLAACAPVGPDFIRPETMVSAYLPAAEASALGPSPAEPGRPWWTSFGSPEIDAMVEQALANNPTIAEADATLDRAGARVRAIAGTRRVQIDANARIERERVNLATYGFPGDSPELTLYSIGGDVAFPLDLFGGRRRQFEAAVADRDAARYRLDAARLTIAGNVVAAAFDLAALGQERTVAEALVSEAETNADLAEKARRAGSGTMVNVIRAKSQLEQDRAQLPGIRQRIAETRHRLAILTGRLPADWVAPDILLGSIALPPATPLTLPSALVRNRPDILQAEASLHAATARIGVATARLYPDVTLGASLLQGAPNLGSVLDSSFSGWTVFAGLTAPIFHGGTLTAERQAAVEEARAQAALYRSVVLRAFGEIADLLTALDNDRDEVAITGQAVALAKRSLQLSRRSFEVGNSGVLDILDAERSYQRALFSQVTARARQYRHVAALYAATAGGLADRTPDAPMPPVRTP